MRYTYKKIQQGQKTPKGNLTQDQIERLEEIGFKWDLANKTAFEQRCHGLKIFKSGFGHCNVAVTTQQIHHWEIGAVR